jgi:outer membrane autotransporter protein
MNKAASVSRWPRETLDMSWYLLRKSIRPYSMGLCAITAGLFAQTIAAAPPSITGAPIIARVPDISSPAVNIDLRALGVIAGSGPLSIQPASIQFLVNGARDPGVIVSVYPNNGPGHVCLRLQNSGNFPLSGGQTYALAFTVNNLLGPPSSTPSIAITNTTGNEVDTAPEAAACDDPNTAPVANAGADRTVADTDGQPGENVALTGSGSDADPGTVLTYQWFANDGPLGPASSSPTLTANLPSGVNDVTLVVVDDSGDGLTNSSTDLVQITVAGPVSPIVDAGADQVVPDSDRNPGELVTLTGIANDPDGSIVSFQWLLGATSLGTGSTLQTRLPDGVNLVTLVVVDNAGITIRDTVQITVAVPVPRGSLAALPNLDPKQQSTARALDRVCNDLESRAGSAGVGLSSDQRDLLRRCDGIYFKNSVTNQIRALDELVVDDFAVARTQTLLFANTQYMSVMDRLIALRGGAKGLSLAGLNIIVEGKMVPLAQLQEIAQEMLGGGASSDADEPGGLLSDKWGLWARGNYSFGKKDSSPSSPSFDADQWSLIGGIDYRLSDKAVVGASLAYGNSSVEFNPSSEGALDTTSWAASLYGSMYAARNFYFDGILNVANSSYNADRNITYVDGTGPVSADASGDTDGLTLSGGLSGGYDFLIGGLTVSPNLGFFYIDTTIDRFTEKGAGGLNLIYDEQKFKSLAGNLGLRFTYAWNLSWGVLLPHLRVDYVREFENDVNVFGVRFAADPNANSAPPILVETDNPDQSYWRLATGFSAQFKYGFSGYIEYQRLESFELISFQDVSIGLRMQRSF